MKTSFGSCWWFVAALLAVGLWFAAAPAQAAELVMFQKAGCKWCARWNREIAPVYGKTWEAKCAPLRRVDLEGERPADLADIAGIRYTPTFVVIDHGREIGRVTGYPGEDFFWTMLDAELGKLTGCRPSS